MPIDDRFLAYYRLRDEVLCEKETLLYLREACLRTGGGLVESRKSRCYNSVLEADVIEMVDREQALQKKIATLLLWHKELFQHDGKASFTVAKEQTHVT